MCAYWNFKLLLLLFSHSVVSDFVIPWTAACQPSLFFSISWSFCKLMSIQSVMPSNNLILCCPVLFLPSIFPSIKVFCSQLLAACGQSIRASVSTSVLLMNIQDWFPRTDWFDHLAVQKTLNSRLQNHSSKALILRCSAFFMGQLFHAYMTKGKTIALTI